MRCLPALPGLAVPALALLAGCWSTDRAELPHGTVPFTPAAGGPDGWSVAEFEVPQACPDGENGLFYVVYPDDATTPLPVAVILHSGPFDYVRDPGPVDPLAGDHYRPDDDRLNLDWSINRVFFTLGMAPDDDPLEDSNGALAAAFANQGIAMVLPADCWGDLWHGYQSTADENDFAADRFYRNGKFAAEWAWRMASEPGFASANRTDLPVGFDTTHLYLVGLGEGARGVGELLHAGLTPPTGVLLDSPTDDLRPYYTLGTDQANSYVEGLNRIFPQGADQTTGGMVGTSPVLPPLTALLYSSADTEIPVSSNDAAINKTAGVGGWVYDSGASKHVLTESDPTLAAQVVNFLMGNGVPQ